VDEDDHDRFAVAQPLHCEECGANLAGDGSCLTLFHTLLAAEASNQELRWMHGLTVLTYYLQHPSLTRSWFQIYGAEVMRRVFGGGEDWSNVLLENHPRGVGRRQSAATLARLKSAGLSTLPDWVITEPIPGEVTVACINPAAPAGQELQVLDWARSVAERRFLQSR
jgi:hypothetical protein